MGFGVGVGFGPVRVSGGISSRGCSTLIVGMLALGAVIYVVRLVANLVSWFFAWPIRLMEPETRSWGLDAVARAAVTWAAEGLWVETLLLLAAASLNGRGVARLYLGPSGMKGSSRFWRFWSVLLFPVVMFATIGMALAPEPGGGVSPPAPAASPAPANTGRERPTQVPQAARRAVVTDILSGDQVRIGPATADGASKAAVARLLGLRAPHGSACGAAWAKRRLASRLSSGGLVWVLTRASSPSAVYLWNSDGELINALVLKDGAARAFTVEVGRSMRARFQAYEDAARADERGVHGCPRG
ncbi:hypothetical protein HII36_11105 [Nonomuraea sp. NN258]|uniref:thermonuclease family protein n=1 Tax=Nonomuraea antri TaxID=2730852 RepID=UPI001568E061|nr:hypothetical protein [Nonomuraea antri]NRQ32383.1 hypothetical protein [Nonomuraea antri]